MNHHKPHMQTPVVSRYPAPAPVRDFVLLFLPPCGPHLTPLATGSLKSSLLVSPLLRGPRRHRPFALALHLHQRKSSRNLHLQDSAKSKSTPRCQSLITARSDHPPILGHSGPHLSNTRVRTVQNYQQNLQKHPEEYGSSDQTSKTVSQHNGLLDPATRVVRPKQQLHMTSTDCPSFEYGSSVHFPEFLKFSREEHEEQLEKSGQDRPFVPPPWTICVCLTEGRWTFL
jgi:hypothetical protein